MKNKRDVRLSYYEGIRKATLDHIKATEESILNLQGLGAEKVQKLVADVHKHHEKLLGRIERRIESERARED